jgi:DNA repair protein RadC
MSDKHQSYRIRDLPTQDRPRERLIALGPQSLNHAELLAILLRIGARGRSAVQVAQELLHRVGGLAGLQRAAAAELCDLPGVGTSKACTLLAAIELGRRIASLPPEDRPLVSSPAQAAALVQYEMSALDQEHLRVLLLDTRNRLVHIAEVYRGSLNTSLVRIGEVFREALRHNAAGLIVVHNHPSGDPSPSPEDVALTRSLVEAGKLLDLQVLDHLIIGQGRFVSLRERGLGFAT